MLGRTHLSIGVLLLFVLARYTGLVQGREVLAASLILLGSILPDIDSANSILGRKMKFLKWFTKHRGFFHSIAGMVFFTVLVQVAFSSRALSIVFMAGYASHLVVDSVTKEGTRIFYPAKPKLKGPLVVGSMAEGIIFLLLVALAVYLVI